MSKFMPGPWEIVDVALDGSQHNIVAVASGGYGWVGDHYMYVGGVCTIDDARLIAAAPDLFAMVGKLMRVIEAGIPDLEDVDEYQMAVALLAKIDGGAA